MSKIIKKIIYLCIVAFPFLLHGTIDLHAPYHIIFIHLGPQLPSYMHTALAQTYLFCTDVDIVLIANKQTMQTQKIPDYVHLIYAEDIEKTIEHQLFLQFSKLNRTFRNGFWFYTTERLFYLYDLIATYDLKHIFHIENDNLLYVDLRDLLPIFIERYPGIAAPFESDDRGFANFLYIPNTESCHALVSFLRAHAHSGIEEMSLINAFRVELGSDYIDHLPTVMPEYIRDHSLAKVNGRKCRIDPLLFCKNSDAFCSLFDGCTYGQYLGGIDPQNGNDGPGYINLDSFFNASFMNIIWERDSLGRKVPYAVYKGAKYRINNLHIHSKKLQNLASF